MGTAVIGLACVLLERQSMVLDAVREDTTNTTVVWECAVLLWEEGGAIRGSVCEERQDHVALVSGNCMQCVAYYVILLWKFYGHGGSTKPITENTLFYGDNLIILRELIPSEARNARQK